MEPLLAGGVPDLELDLLAAELDRLDLEVDADRRDERVVERVVGKSAENCIFKDVLKNSFCFGKGKNFGTYLKRMQVFPTPESPMRRSLKSKS